jgi:predicted transcriptional regulator
VSKVRHSKIEVLKFIRKQGIIQVWELREQFGFTDNWCGIRLTRLKQEKLVINQIRDRWILTELGYRRLEYYDEKDNNKAG